MRHILFTLKGCNVELMEDKEYMRGLLYMAAKESKSTLLDLTVHKFDPQGLTGIAMLADSHISIHTWPEKGMAVCDAFTCGDHTDPQAAVEYMRDKLESTDMVSKMFIRPLD
jgi:S-adenosylmethionine decarboxylase